jgi:hypothetical protein
VIEIVPAVRTDLRWKFHLTDKSDQDECMNIQDQVLAVVFGWA